MNKNNAIHSNAQTNTCKNPESVIGTKWEGIKARIRPFLAPTDWKWTLDGTPQLAYGGFLDLSVFYYIPFINDDAKKTMIAWIDRTMLDSWNVTMQTLEKQAVKNLRGDGYTIQRIGGVIGAFLDNCPVPDDMEDLHLYVLTNKKFFWGASGFLDKSILKSFAKETDRSLYIIPSSIHELLLLPDFGQTNKEELDQMIREVNAAQVKPCDRLSDHAYYYDMAMDEIRTER